MKLFNTDTNQMVEISMIKNGEDEAFTVISRDPNIFLNHSNGMWEADSETIEFWETWVKQDSIADNMETALKQIVKDFTLLGYKKSFDWILNKIPELNQEAGWCDDFSDVPVERQKLFKNLYNEIQAWWNSNEIDKVTGYLIFENDK